MANILREQINLKQTESHTYTISYHKEWSLGPVLLGGVIASAIHQTVTKHMCTTLAAQNQPDVLTLHLEFLRACELCDSTIAVDDLKIGSGTSTLQLKLVQNGKIRVIALANSTNFERDIGPSAPTAWSLQPAPKPRPDFGRVLAHKPDPNWLPAYMVGELCPLSKHLLYAYPSNGITVDGVCDGWATIRGDESMDAPYLSMMTDMIPSLSDTLLRNGGLYDAHRNYAQIKDWAEKNPGVPVLLTNTLKEAMRATEFNQTLILDIEFKRRPPKEGVKWVFNRAVTRVLKRGRMDLEVTLLDENMDILVLSRQVILVLEPGRKFTSRKIKASI